MKYQLNDLGEAELIDYTALDAQTSKDVLAMRNHPDIRKWMHDKQVISASEHQRFLQALAHDKAKQYFILRTNDAILGTFNFVGIDREQATSSFGLYANPQLTIPGLGKALMDVAVQYAKDERGLKTLQLHAITDNRRAIEFYHKCGFRQTGKGQVKGDTVIFFTKNLDKSDE